MCHLFSPSLAHNKIETFKLSDMDDFGSLLEIDLTQNNISSIPEFFVKLAEQGTEVAYKLMSYSSLFTFLSQVLVDFNPSNKLSSQHREPYILSKRFTLGEGRFVLHIFV